MSAQHLKRFGLLSMLAEDEREALEALLEARDLARGEVLFAESDESHGLVLLERGRLRIASERTGQQGTLHPGAALGALSLIAIGPREVSASAIDPARVLVLSRSAFRRLLDEAPRASARLLESVLAETASLLRGGLDRLAASDGDGAS